MLYIMRHGKTDWNELRKLQGRTDIELNEEGREMARKASKEYKDVHFDVCFCSPLKRAKETAAASDTSKPILPLRIIAMGLATMTRPIRLKTRVMAFLRVKAS